MRAFLNSFSKNKRDNLMTVQAAFNVFDKDGSGALDAEEIKAIFMRPGGGAALSDEDAVAVIAEFDVNGDGMLQYDEVRTTPRCSKYVGMCSHRLSHCSLASRRTSPLAVASRLAPCAHSLP